MTMPEIKALPPPPLNIPSSPNTCDLWLIDATCEIVCSSRTLMQPEIKGHEKLNLPTFVFYIHNPRLNQRVLFDNGARKDWWNSPPAVVRGITGKGVLGLDVKHDVYDLLSTEEGGERIVHGDEIDAVIWSHFHYDHTGNIQRFPVKTKIVVGPGFKAEFLPGYPIRADSPFYQSDFEAGRELVELAFDSGLKIGRYDAYDFFGDGSFYLLNTPGHTVGHISGLVRTTPDTFVFLGGDISHFPGMYRPTKYVPMPTTLPLETKLDTPRLPVPCPCSLFTACHPKRKPLSDRDTDEAEEARTSTFYEPPQDPWSWYNDPAEALRSVDALKEFDANENVFVAIAHDPALREVVDLFPKGKMNHWKVKGWAQQSHWHFVNELPIDGLPGRKLIAQGLMKDGEMYRG